ncbi:MAG: DUF3500 domain-containing protein [Desulfobacterales bacterium]|nr:MAG: DUF3500 domain-containing protein [Desulfobacterales bacterium]
MAASLLFTMMPDSYQISTPAAAARMFQASETFLNSLSSKQRQAACFAFENDERYDWHYVPRKRSGLTLKDMTADQQALARAFLKTGLSQSGYWKSVTIMRLETVLHEIETFNMGRDPEKYFFSFFGIPSENGTWGWRVEGHHLSLNFTIVKGRLLATAPRFLGANPANITAGELSGLRTLAGEEDLARKLLNSLNPEQKKKAVFREQAYSDIVTGNEEMVSPLKQVGIAAASLDGGQMDFLIRLIDEYVSALTPEIARQRTEAVRNSDLHHIHFGWAGALEPGYPHYYRIQGTSFLIEYDNVQNSANHIHTVWRDFNGDFGRDLLKEHYRRAHL